MKPHQHKSRNGLAACAVIAVALFGLVGTRRANTFIGRVEPPQSLPSVGPDERFARIQGVDMPMVGLGTAGLIDSVASVRIALRHGYRLIDSASEVAVWYRNEKSIGEYIANSGYNRSEVFITTKLHPQDLGTASTRRSLDNSLANLHSTYIDLWLMHFPFCWGDICEHPAEGTWRDSWRVLEDAWRRKQAKLIGVCNFHMKDLEELIAFSEVKPHVIQNWCDPFHQDRETRAFCKRHGIHYQAYSSLGSQWLGSKKKNPVFSSPVLQSLAAKYRKTVSQIVLRWLLQSGVSVIPKSNHESHIKDNIQLFDFSLSREDMAIIDGLDGSIGSLW